MEVNHSKLNISLVFVSLVAIWFWLDQIINQEFLCCMHFLLFASFVVVARSGSWGQAFGESLHDHQPADWSLQQGCHWAFVSPYIITTGQCLCMCTHTHTHAHIYNYMHTHTYVLLMHAHTHTCMHTHIHSFTHSPTHVCIHTHTHTHTAGKCVHTYTHAVMHVHTHTCTQKRMMHIHKCMHTCTHTYSLAHTLILVSIWNRF